MDAPTTPPEPGTGSAGRVVTFEELVWMVGRPKHRKARPRPAGQLDLLDLLG
jgi:hypothetical protein